MVSASRLIVRVCFRITRISSSGMPTVNNIGKITKVMELPTLPSPAGPAYLRSYTRKGMLCSLRYA